MNEQTRSFVQAHLHDDVRQLALKKAPTDVDLRYALQQIEARQLLSAKVPTWANNELLEFPPHLSLEQCSSEATARYKSTLVSGHSLVDLTGGLGIDCYFLAEQFPVVHYVEHLPHLVKLAQHNFEQLGANITVHEAEAESFLQQLSGPVSAIYLDPARRDQHGQKVVSVADCTPNVAEFQAALLNHAPQVLIKLSPMLDLAQLQREMHHIKALHVVAVNNECKEILALLSRDFDGEPTITAVNLPQTTTFTFTQNQEQKANLHLAEAPMHYLYEPNAALLKAGAFKSIAEHFGIDKLHINSHLYTSDKLIAKFPGRTFEVEDYAPFGKKIGATLLADLRQANITTRNFPLSVADLRKRLKLADGGDTYLFATTLANEQKIIIRCKKVMQ